jgi:hypothetical protein
MTLWPAASNSFTTAEPIKPVAPVTKTRIRSSSVKIKVLRQVYYTV